MDGHILPWDHRSNDVLMHFALQVVSTFIHLIILICRLENCSYLAFTYHSLFLLGMEGRSGVNARSPFLSFFLLPFSSLFPLPQSPRSFLHFTLACYYRWFTHPHTLSLFLEPFFVNNTLIQRLDSCTHSILFQYPSHTFTTNNDFILNSLFHSLHVAPPLNRPSSPDLNTHSCAAQ